MSKVPVVVTTVAVYVLVVSIVMGGAEVYFCVATVVFGGPGSPP